MSDLASVFGIVPGSCAASPTFLKVGTDISPQEDISASDIHAMLPPLPPAEGPLRGLTLHNDDRPETPASELISSVCATLRKEGVLPASDEKNTTEAKDTPSSLLQYQGAPLPENEVERVAFLRKLDLLDTVSEEAFDVITRLLTDIYQVPIALVSLVDTSRQWFKSVVGLDVRETSRNMSFCAHLLLPEEPEVLLVPNALEDPRFMNNPLVTGEPYIRFYLGAPIILDGHRLGSLCIIDRIPRPNITKKDAMFLANFTNIISRLIAKDRKQCEQYEMTNHPSFLIEVTGDMWPIVYYNKCAKTLMSATVADSPCFLEWFDMGEVVSGQMLQESRAQNATFANRRPCVCVFHPASQHGFGFGPQETIMYPYSDAPRAKCRTPELDITTPQAGTPSAAGFRGEGTGSVVKEYNFVIVKWRDGNDPCAPCGSFVPASIPSAPLSSMPTTMYWIQSGGEFYDVISKGLVLVMVTSEFCLACVHFLEFYQMVCSLTPGVRFCLLSVDYHCDVAAMLSPSAVMLPSVYYHKNGNLVDQLCGAKCALFRDKLAQFILGSSSDDCLGTGRNHLTEETPPRRSSLTTEHLARMQDELAASSDSVEGDTDEPSMGCSMLTDLTIRLGAEKTYGCNLEMSLDCLMSCELKELRQSHEAALARMSLLQNDLSSRGKQKRHQAPRRSLSFDDPQTGDVGIPRYPRGNRALPGYHFHGTVANFLAPVLLDCRVLIYGGPRANHLQAGMSQAGIDASHQSRTARLQPIPTNDRHGRLLAVVDVIDSRCPRETLEWFEKVSDALSVGGVLATISVDFDILEGLAMLGETFAWSVTCTEGSGKDYGILVLQKGPTSDLKMSERCWQSGPDAMHTNALESPLALSATPLNAVPPPPNTAVSVASSSMSPAAPPVLQ